MPSLLGVGDARPPRWCQAVNLVVSSLNEIRDTFVLIGHSGAGALLPVIGKSLHDRVAAYVFVDAILPPTSGEITPDPSWLAHLRSLAIDGRLPPWSEWWGPEAMRTLVPDDQIRETIEAELPELPLSYFEESIPVPEAWDRVPVGYIRFSESYEAASMEATCRGHVVEEMPGGHLHAVVEPASVARRIVEVVDKLTTKLR